MRDGLDWVGLWVRENKKQTSVLWHLSVSLYLAVKGCSEDRQGND